MTNCAATQHLRVLNARKKKSGAYRNTLASLPRKRNTEAKLCFANACEVRILFNQKREGDMYERTISISSFRVVKKVSQNFRMEGWLDGRWCKKPFPWKHGRLHWGMRRNNEKKFNYIEKENQTFANFTIISNGTTKRSCFVVAEERVECVFIRFIG